MSEGTPDVILSEANASDTWRPPTPYKNEYAIKVNNSHQKKNHYMLFLIKIIHVFILNISSLRFQLKEFATYLT